MNSKIRDYIFLILCASIVFNEIPNNIRLNFLGGEYSNLFAVYPLLLGIACTGIWQYKNGNILIAKEKMSRYCIIYVVILSVSLIHGLFIYPYYTEILNGPVSQIQKLPLVLKLLSKLGLNLDTSHILVGWMGIRFFKTIILDFMYSFGGAYLIFCWYYNNKERAFKIFSEGISISMGIFFLYGIIECLYLAHFRIATETLKIINPFIHTIEVSHGWWPKYLSPDQFRSVFPEPSHIGNYMAIIIPFITTDIIYGDKGKKRTNVKKYLLLFLSAFSIFLTKARTPNAMLIGMMILLLFSILSHFKKESFKQYIYILCVIGVSFLCSLGFMNFKNNRETLADKSIYHANKFIEDNIGTLASDNKRSNGARYSMLRYHVRLGLSHPILGVGKGLHAAYANDYLTDKEKNYREVRLWLDDQKKEGILKSNLGALNEYIGRFSDTGLSGLIVFLFPFIWIIFKLWEKIQFDFHNDNQENLKISFFLLYSLISCLASGFNILISVVYGVWVVLGLSFLWIYGSKNKSKSVVGKSRGIKND